MSHRANSTHQEEKSALISVVGLLGGAKIEKGLTKMKCLREELYIACGGNQDFGGFVCDDRCGIVKECRRVISLNFPEEVVIRRDVFDFDLCDDFLFGPNESHTPLHDLSRVVLVKIQLQEA